MIERGKKGIMYWIMFVLIFIGAFLIIRFIFKVFFNILYVVIIGAVAFLAAGFILKKVFGGGDGGG